MKRNTAISISVATLLLLPLSVALAVEPFFDVFYDATATVQLSLKSLPRTEVVRLKGHVVIRTFAIGDMDRDGRPDMETEIVSMSLTGTTSQGIAVNLNSSKSNRSQGMTEQLMRMPVGIGGTNLPANSFFDIFVELRHTPFHNSPAASAVPDDALTSCKPVHLAGISRSLTDLSGAYRMSGKISLCNRSGEPVGGINFLAVNLNSSKSN